MTKKEILKLIDDKYDGDRNKFYEDYPDIESFKNGGNIPMYQNGTDNAFMAAPSYSAGVVDYGNSSAESLGTNNYEGSFVANTNNINSLSEDPSQAAIRSGATAAATAYNPLLGAGLSASYMASDAIKDSANTMEVEGIDTGVGATNKDQNKIAGATLLDPTSGITNIAKYSRKDEDTGKRNWGNAALSILPGSSYFLAKQEQKEGEEEAIKAQTEIDNKKDKFDFNQNLIADQNIIANERNNLTQNTSGYGSFYGKNGGYATPQAEIENGEIIEGTTGAFKATGNTHENGGIEISFSENGTPIAGKGGRLTKMYEGGGKMSSSFVSSNNMKVPKDMASRLLKI